MSKPIGSRKGQKIRKMDQILQNVDRQGEMNRKWLIIIVYWEKRVHNNSHRSEILFPTFSFLVNLQEIIDHYAN